MRIKQFEIWIADLSPQIGTELGKRRPVLVIQTDLLNKLPHPSTIICPITTNTKDKAEILRVHLKKGMANIQQDSDIMIDQMRAIDNQRLINRVGELPFSLRAVVKENVRIVLDINE